MRETNYYAAGPLDRVSHLREDEAWLAARLSDSESRLVPVWRARNLVSGLGDPEGLTFALQEMRHLWERAEFTAFLGLVDGVAHFAVDIPDEEDPITTLATDGIFEDLRNVGPALDKDHGAILAYARGLFSWHRRHLFCGVCGHATESVQAGHVRRCVNQGCGAQHFPRLDPAVIVLIHDGGDRCVLGRSKRLLPGMYSTLAGFVEPGESLEDTVRREMKEESGLDVTDVTYHSSQPWPFPSSLMLGYYARATNTEISCEDDEIEDVGWYDRDALKKSPENETFRLPRRDSIARRLIDEWIYGA